MQANRSPDAGLRVEARQAVLVRPRAAGQPLDVPVVPASHFRAAPPGVVGRECSRDDGTPGRGALEEPVGDLEGGPAGAFSSGMADLAAALDTAAPDTAAPDTTAQSTVRSDVPAGSHP
ncbi:hypothetical protein ACI8AC_23825 [Geodermatophilus sp. SYSU D00758]